METDTTNLGLEMSESSGRDRLFPWGMQKTGTYEYPRLVGIELESGNLDRYLLAIGMGPDVNRVSKHLRMSHFDGAPTPEKECQNERESNTVS